jgi:hypothetical protein
MREILDFMVQSAWAPYSALDIHSTTLPLHGALAVESTSPNVMTSVHGGVDLQ